MDFQLWLEGTEAFTKDIIDAIFKSVEFMIPGNWKMTQNVSVPDTATTQLNRHGKLVGTDVKQPGDQFNAVIWVRTYKRHKEDRKLSSPLPAWVKDPSQWVNVDKYDVSAGHELVQINVSISVGGGKWSFLRIIGDSWQDQLANLKTPLDAAKYIKFTIDKYKDGDDDGGDNAPAAPTPAPSGKLVGV